VLEVERFLLDFSANIFLFPVLFNLPICIPKEQEIRHFLSFSCKASLRGENYTEAVKARTRSGTGLYPLKEQYENEAGQLNNNY
jgi:hypothetical protein